MKNFHGVFQNPTTYVQVPLQVAAEREIARHYFSLVRVTLGSGLIHWLNWLYSHCVLGLKIIKWILKENWHSLILVYNKMRSPCTLNSVLLLPYPTLHPPTHTHTLNILSYIKTPCNVTLKLSLRAHVFSSLFQCYSTCNVICLIKLFARNRRQGRLSMPWTGWFPCWALHTRQCLHTHWSARSQHPSFSLQTCSDSCLQWVHCHPFQPIWMSLCSSDSMACSTDESPH